MAWESFEHALSAHKTLRKVYQALSTKTGTFLQGSSKKSPKNLW